MTESGDRYSARCWGSLPRPVAPVAQFEPVVIPIAAGHAPEAISSGREEQQPAGHLLRKALE